jgi:ribosomal protein S18 acetylase RimI-like enzyme
MPEYTLRSATPDDLALVKHAIFVAMAWDPARALPPEEHLLVHPELVKFHRDWGRTGDVGVVAEADGQATGIAFCRLFTDDDHGEGYVDAETPELVIAVWPEHRNRGLGARLLEALEKAASAEGRAQISLSVDAANPAVRLYRRAGYDVVREDGRGLLMLKRINPPG